MDELDPEGSVSTHWEGVDRAAPLPVSAETLGTLRDRVPGLKEPAHLALLAESLFGDHTHESADDAGRTYRRVAIPARRLAEMEGAGRAYRQKIYQGRDFLERHRTVLPTFEYTGWQARKYYRQVRHHGLPDDLLALVEDDLAVPVADLGDAVDLRTGRPVPSPYTGTGGARRAGRRRALAREAERRPALCDEQGELLAVLNGAPPNVLARLVKQNAAAAARAALGAADPFERARELMALRRVQYQPAPPYVPSPKRRTVRVSPLAYPSAVSLRKTTRRALLDGTVTLDLANAQLALAASEWAVPLVLDLLEREGSAWPYLLRLVRGHHAADPAGTKGALKGAVYSTVFGMSEEGVRLKLGRSLSWAAAKAFLADPVVGALFEARTRALDRIVAEGGARDCFGVWYPLRAGRDPAAEARKALASRMQARELSLLMPVVREAARVAAQDRPQFRIALWLHDGFSVRVRHDRRGVVRRLRGLVQAEADALGVPTSLTVEGA